jgi:hypothetical protein
MLRVLSTRSEVAEKNSGIVCGTRGPYLGIQKERIGERGIVEFVGLMGYYDVVAMMLITANAVPPQDADVPRLQPLVR